MDTKLEKISLVPALPVSAPTSPILCRVAVLGNGSVGKTCIVHHFSTSNFLTESYPTIGAAFKTFTIPINEKLIELHIFDCAGQERFNTLLPLYLRGVSSVILVYSVDDLASQSDILKRWNDFILGHPIDSIYLVGNKNDLLKDSETQLSSPFITSCCNTLKQHPDLKRLHVFSTSAKTGSGIDNLFFQIAEDCYLKNVDSLPDDIVCQKSLTLTNNSNSVGRQWKLPSMCCTS